MKSIFVGFILGVVGLGGARYFFVPPEEAVHHHANWAMFVNGARVDLSGDVYMEDVAVCYAAGGDVTPASRVHMHEGSQDVVHVHHGGTTWGHLLANLEFGSGKGYLATDSGDIYRNGEEGTLKFVLNGRGISAAHNEVIRSEDRLLISFGTESLDEIIAGQFSRVSNTAGEFNLMQDPATCSGGHQPLGLADRLKAAFWG